MKKLGLKTSPREIRLMLEEGAVDEAAQLLINDLTTNKPEVKPGTGLSYFQKLIPAMLGNDMYLEVATIIWGPALFTTEPESVQRIWRELPDNATLTVIGAGSLGKSYTPAAWLLLDWLEDPEWTCIKVVSMTAEHAKRNVYAHIKNLHARSIIPLPGRATNKSIQANDDDKQGIHLVAIPQGEDGSGRMQGFHPVPRPMEHVKYGKTSRVRAVLDEAEEIPPGVWKDIDNMLITINDTEHVKVFTAANPRHRNSQFGIRCEPEGEGWPSVNMDSSKSWHSRYGWRVIRLDGADCENVREKKLVHDGFLSYEGFQRYAAQGTSSREYQTMARGWFPEDGADDVAIPRTLLDEAVGQFIFTGATTYAMAVDLAFEGGDEVVATIGRWGQVRGHTDRHGKQTTYQEPRNGLQIEQCHALPKEMTLALTRTIMRSCKNLYIQPDWLMVDRTGNGTGVHDALREQFGHRVQGLHYGEAASEMRVLEDDSETAEELYDGVVTELFFAVRKLTEFGAVKFSANLSNSTLFTELSDRRYRLASKKRVRIEPKKEYAKRNGGSPDRADSCTLLVHLIRKNWEIPPAMFPGRKATPDPRTGESSQYRVDNLEQIAFSND